MEKENKIEMILNSTNGMTKVVPSDVLFSKIEQKILKLQRVPPKTVWLVAASIVVLVMLNISAIKSNSQQESTTTTYMSETINQSNQLYQ